MIDIRKDVPGISVHIDTVNVYMTPGRVPAASPHDPKICEDCCFCDHESAVCFWFEHVDLSVHAAGFLCPDPRRSARNAELRHFD